MSSSTEVPGKYDCAIEGQGFMLDNKHDAFKAGIDTIQLLRLQADPSNEPGESSVNPEDMWPRTQHTFHKGAGQQWLDVDNGDRFRYNTSRGLSPWTKGRIETLNTSSIQYDNHYTGIPALSNKGIKVLNVNDQYLYTSAATFSANEAADKLIFWNVSSLATTPLPTPLDSSIQAGESTWYGGQPTWINDICTDGVYVYAITDRRGVHTTPIGSTSGAAHYNDLNGSLIGSHKGRIIVIGNSAASPYVGAGFGYSIFNVTGSGAAPTPLFSHPNTGFNFTALASGPRAIYAGGYAGSKSEIYSITIKDDATGLNVPKSAAEMPLGEQILSLCGYLNYIVIGTDKGIRVAEVNSDDSLTLGALIETANPVLCFAPKENYVWFGMTNLDTQYTGTGRLDLGQLTDNLVPAYASDTAVGSAVVGFGTQGTVNSIAHIGGRVFFTIRGSAGGIARESTDAGWVSAYFETSEITFGLAESKTALELQIEHEPLPQYGQITAYISVDGGAYTLLGQSNVQGSRKPSAPFSITGVTGGSFKLKFVLSSEANAAFSQTALNRYTLKAYPVIASRGRIIEVPLLLHEEFLDANGAMTHMDPGATWDYVQNFADTGAQINYQELNKSYTAFIDKLTFERRSRTQDGNAWNGVLVCQLKVLG